MLQFFVFFCHFLIFLLDQSKIEAGKNRYRSFARNKYFL